MVSSERNRVRFLLICCKWLLLPCRNLKMVNHIRPGERAPQLSRFLHLSTVSLQGSNLVVVTLKLNNTAPSPYRVLSDLRPQW
jgi:hypothetical protein